ncbi:DUF2798 domain-containing protein [Thalassospira sp. MA62]|nr:DUF2798 domain-containing protein [Thalassospira sp. MA62]
MLPKRFYRLVFAVLMSVWMSFVMTAVVTVVNTGLDDGFVVRWGRAFISAWPIAFVVVLSSAGYVGRLASHIVSRPAEVS